MSTRPLTRLRPRLILGFALAISLAFAGGVGVSAGAAKHRHKPVHHKVKPTKEPVGVLARIGAALPPPSLFGVTTGTYDTSHANFLRDIPTARSIGARWDNFTSGSVHFYADGRPNWGVLDHQVTEARRNNLGVMISLGGSPAACSIPSALANPRVCPPTTARDLTAYKSFVSAELLRYHNDVQYWESWKEPNNNAYWAPRTDPAQYANVLRAQYEAFQSFNRTHHADMKLIFAGPISFSTIPTPGGSIAVLPFVHAVLHDLHGARVFDAIGLHAYRFPQNNNGPADENWGPTAVFHVYVGGIPNAPGANGPYPAQGCDQVYSGFCLMNWTGELSAYEQEFENQGYGRVPLWLTEFGWPGNASPTTALFPSFTTQAQNLSQAYSVIRHLPFIQAAFWFNLRDFQPGIASPDPLFFYHYGLLQYNFTPKPAAREFEQLAGPNPLPACPDPAGAFNRGFNAGFNPGFNAGFNPGYNSGFNRGYQVGFGRSRTGADTAARLALSPACDQTFNQGFNTGFNPGFNAGFKRGFQVGFNPGFNAGFRARRRR